MTFTVDEVMKVMENLGVDTECGECLCIGLGGTGGNGGNPHTCQQSLMKRLLFFTLTTARLTLSDLLDDPVIGPEIRRDDTLKSIQKTISALREEEERLSPVPVWGPTRATESGEPGTGPGSAGGSPPGSG